MVVNGGNCGYDFWGAGGGLSIRDRFKGNNELGVVDRCLESSRRGGMSDSQSWYHPIPVLLLPLWEVISVILLVCMLVIHFLESYNEVEFGRLANGLICDLAQ